MLKPIAEGAAWRARAATAATLRYATFLGGADLDVANALAVAAAGNADLAGRTGSSDFPMRRARQTRLAGHGCQALRGHANGEPCHDAFVAKLDASGGLVYSTYLGGSRNDEAAGMAVDRRGRAYVAGNTDSRDFPTRRGLPGRFRTRCPGDAPCPPDAFVAKLSADGRSLVYATYLGGAKGDTSGGVAVDRAGAAYVTGTTRSSDFPTHRARQRLHGTERGPPPGVSCPDAFVVKLRPSGRALAYGTFLGGKQTEAAGGIAVDRAGNAYLAGSTQSPDFPVVRALQPRIDNRSCSTTGPPEELCNDAFVTKLSADGQRLRYSTFLGGNGEDQGLGIAVDRAGRRTWRGPPTRGRWALRLRYRRRSAVVSTRISRSSRRPARCARMRRRRPARPPPCGGSHAFAELPGRCAGAGRTCGRLRHVRDDAQMTPATQRP